MSPKEMAALQFAFEKHLGQADKQGQPYILHVLRVAFENVAGCSENILCAALLHDVVEDCGVSVAEIRSRFGERIATAVDHLSRRKGESYTAYIKRLKGDYVAVRVKRADLADNLMESRMSQLSEEDQKRLRSRYVKATSMLADAS